MAFEQFKLDRSSLQTRGIFNRYVYETDDQIDEVREIGYFAQSRFKEIDSPTTNGMGWVGGFMDIFAAGVYHFGKITSDGNSVEIITAVSGLIVQDTFVGPGSFVAEPGNIYPVDTTSGPVTVTISTEFETGDCFGIEDATLNFSLNNLTVDFGAYNYYSGANGPYLGNEDGEGAVFCLRSEDIGFVVRS